MVKLELLKTAMPILQYEAKVLNRFRKESKFSHFFKLCL